MKDISIIIPTKNCRHFLDKCLDSITSLNFPQDRMEVIIVDAHSVDGTLDVASKYGCRIVFEDVGNQAAAYNAGIKESEGSYLVFTDADCVVPRDWLNNLLKNFHDENVASVGGPNLTPSDDTKLAKRVGAVLGFLSKPGARYGMSSDRIKETFHNPTCNVAYRRDIIEKVCGFNENLVTCADEELDYRIREEGYKILYTPEAKVFHYRRASYKKFALQAYKYAVGRAQAIRLHRKMAKWFHFAPSIMICLVALFFALSYLNLLYFYVGLSATVCGTIGICLISLHLSRKARMNSPFSFFALIITWLGAYGLGFFRGLVS